MADTYAYDDTNDADLQKDWIKRHSNGYLREHHLIGKTATLDKTSPTATTMTITDETITEDQYNAGYLLMQDDNGMPNIFTIDDSADSGGDAVFTINLASAVIPGASNVVDNYTAGTFVITICGTERFIGYTNDKKLVPDVQSSDAEVNMPKERLFSYKVSEKGTVTCMLLTSPKDLIDNFYNMEAVTGSPNTGAFKYHVLGQDRPTYMFIIRNIRTRDSNETRTEWHPNCQFDEPELMYEASSGGDTATYALTANVNKDLSLGTDRLNSTV